MLNALPAVLIGLFVYACPAYPQTIDAAATTLNVPSIVVPNPQLALFNSVTAAGSRLVAVGERGRIILSEDQGLSWRQVETPTSVTLTAVRFASPADGWAVGQMGVILHTTDGGATWDMQFNGIRANHELLMKARADAAAAGPGNSVATANLDAAQHFVSGGPIDPFLCILPLSVQNMIVAGAFGMAFTSSDGGRSFKSIFDQIPNPNSLHIYVIIGDGDHEILAGEQGLILKRNQDGSFVTLSSPLQGSFFGGLKTAAGTLVLFGIQGSIIRSTDDGKTWAQVATADTGGIDCGIQLHDGKIVLGNEAGDILLSKDDGVTFSTAALNDPVIALSETPGGALVVAGLHGITRLTAAEFGHRT